LENETGFKQDFLDYFNGLTICLSLFFYEIYMNSFGVDREISLYLRYAPRLENWIDVSSGNGLWSEIHKNLGILQQRKSIERAQGFSPPFMLVFLASSTIGFKKTQL